MAVDNPELEQAVLPTRPTTEITAAERRFVTLLILHISACFEAQKAGALTPLEGLKMDVGNLMSCPRTVWGEIKQLQNAKFVKFIDDELERRARTPSP